MSDEKAPADTTDRYGKRPEKDPLSPALLATIITVPIIVIIAFIAYAALKNGDTATDDSASSNSATPVDDYPLTDTATADCATFVAALPGELEGFGDKSVDGTTVRWTGPDSDAVVLRCGVIAPPSLEATSQLEGVNGVEWLADIKGDDGAVYVVVNFRPYVALWLPKNSGNGPITEVSDLIRTTLVTGDPLESIRTTTPEPSPAG